MKILNDLKERWLLLTLLAAPFLIIAAEWDRFPARVATSPFSYGQPNSWANKTVGLLFWPLLSVALALLLAWLPRVDPKLRRNFQLTREPGIKRPDVIAVSFAAVFSLISLLIAAAALGYTFNLAHWMMGALLGLQVVIGNFMSTLRPNYVFGLRTPWTLKSPEVWKATHRIGGRLVIVGALVLFVLQFLLSPRHFTLATYVELGVLIGWSFLYSYWRFRSRDDSPPPRAGAVRPEGQF